MLLDDGRLMVTGGLGKDGNAISSVEIYDPAIKHWVETAPLLMPLKSHSALSLCDGNVLVIGEIDDSNVQIMLWKRATAQWKPAGHVEHSQFSWDSGLDSHLIARQDGGALVYGNANADGEGLLFQWTPEQPGAMEYYPSTNRTSYTEALLPDGRVLLAGGQVADTATTLAELYDPKTNRFTLTGQMRQARMTGMPYLSLASTVLRDGRVIVAGGWVAAPADPRRPVANSPEVWEPTTGRWHMIERLRFAANERVVFNSLDDGRVLFFAAREYGEKVGKAGFRAWIWNPADNSVLTLKVKIPGRLNAALAVLKDGHVLITGGRTPEFHPAYHCPPEAPPPPPQQSEDANEGDGDSCEDEPEEWFFSLGTSSAQLWDSHTGGVKSLPYPDNWKTLHPQTMLLRNGDVLIYNAGPEWMTVNEPVEQVLRWSAKTRSFNVLPTIKSDFHWPILERGDGSLIARTIDYVTPGYALLLKPGALTWEPFPRFPQRKAELVELSSGQLFALDSVAPNVTVFDEQDSHWQPLSKTYLHDLDSYFTALIELKDGRVAVLGALFDNTISVQLWDRKSDSWTVAKAMLPTHGATGDTTGSAIPLRSGAVMYFSLIGSDTLRCDAWLPDKDKWTPCGSLKRTRKGDISSRFGLGTLADGRTVMIDNDTVAQVYDETDNRWIAMKMEMESDPRLTQAEKPFARVFDAENKTWIDASDAGRLAYAVLNYGRTTVTLPAPDHYREILLWHNKVGDWQRIEHADERAAFWLPDGCVLLAPSLAISNPATGRLLEAPTLQVEKLTVLADGTAVGIANNMGYSEIGAEFFHRKVSCDGFEVVH